MNQFFIQQLKRYGTLSSEAEEAILPKVKTIHKKKNSFVVKAGQCITNLFLIESGTLHSFFREEHIQQNISLWFGYEPYFFAIVDSFFSGESSNENVQCLEDTVLHYLPKTDLDILSAQHPCLQIIHRRIIEEYCSELSHRCFILQTRAAFDKYQLLMKYEPQMLRRIPLKYIASYLGITAETLSRIRGKK